MQTHEASLRIGAKLKEYEIIKVLGFGGFGITYLAKDIYLEKYIVIKEYLPNDIAVRQNHTTVMPKSDDDKENFAYGLKKFLQEARTLAKFNHPNIVKINTYFEANNTAYFVMDYEEGEDLERYLKRNRKLSEEEILSIIMPILDGLREVHKKDFLHRDIKPSNIFLRTNGSPMLIDFGATRYSVGVKSKSLSVILTPGYAPKEQYSSKSKQAPYTDIYAVGAVMYKMATGITPIESSERANAITDDEPDPLIKMRDRKELSYSDNFKKAVDWAMEFKPKDRPQNVKEFQNILMNKKEPPEELPEKPPPKPPTKTPLILSGIVAIVAVAFFVGYMFFDNDKISVSSIENFTKNYYKTLPDNDNNIAYVKLKEIDIKKTADVRAKVNTRVYYLKTNGEFECKNEINSLIYDNNWNISSRKTKKCQDNIEEYEENGIKLTIKRPLFLINNAKAVIKITMLNKESKQRGGLTVGFFNYDDVDITDKGSTFKRVKKYPSGSKIWNVQTRDKIYSKYCIYEGWQEGWSDDNRKKSLYFSFYPQNDKDETKIFIRAVTKNNNEPESIIPSSGIKGQQGYYNISYTIPVINRM